MDESAISATSLLLLLLSLWRGLLAAPAAMPPIIQATPVEVGSTMKLANVPVWLFLRRQDSKVRRCMCLVMGVALLVGCWQLSSNQNNSLSTTVSTTLRANVESSTLEVKAESMNPIQTTTPPKDVKIHNNDNHNKPQLTNDKKRDRETAKGNQHGKTYDKAIRIRDKRNMTGQKLKRKGLPMPMNNISFLLTDEKEFQPKIAWLMSWPNSGTSFTLAGVEKLSNKSIATNYGDEVTGADAYSLSIYPLRIEGPFWKGYTCDEKLGIARELPNEYVLTKTHCGGRCSSCGPKEYVETMRSFLKECASGHGRFPPRRQRHMVHYPPSRVHRAIQLIRNPFHNVVARFHLDRRNKAKKAAKYAQWVEAHPENEEGFSKWCQDMNQEWGDEEEEVFNKTMDMLEVLRPIPCRAEFYMYVQWHNLLHESIEFIRQDTKREIPLLTVRYEDYGKDLHGTFSTILKFLELEKTGGFPEFTPRDDSYQSYFTQEQRKSIHAFLKHAASNSTWNQIQHYFS